MEKTFAEAYGESEAVCTKARADLNEKRDVFHQIVSIIPDSTIDPYPQLLSSLTGMSATVTRLESLTSQLNSMRKQFATLTMGKTKIESSEPEWEQFQSIKSEYQDLVKRFEDIANNYSSASNSYAALANRYRIGVVEVAEIQQQIESFLLHLDESIVEIESGIAENRRIIADARDRDLPSAQINEKEEILNEMETIMASIRDKGELLNTMVMQFRKEADGRQELLTGPGMRTHTIIEDMKSIDDEINSLVNQFNSLARKL